MLIPVEPGVAILHNTKAKIYPNGQQKITICSKPIFKNECWEPVEFADPVSKPKNLDNEVREDNIKRAKERIFDIAMCNQFDYFVTWTLDADKINRYDADEISKKLKTFLNNKVKRNNARYLVIPEHHQDGAIHMHGLLSGDFEMVDSGKTTKDGKTIYNMPQWSLGFSTAIKLDEHKDRVSRYITKYVTKEFKKIFGSFYYAGGHGLVRKPKTELYDVDYDSFELQEYSPEGVNMWFKYINTDSETEC
jgi:hypothetical protein